MFYQIHFGANCEKGEYGWTTDASIVKKQIDWMLRTLRTDYIDYGFIHCIDTKRIGRPIRRMDRSTFSCR